MKLAMKLRTRLFLSISALITVALLGLILGLVSVMQMAKTQESLIRSNFITLDLGLKLRQSLGDQLIMMLEERPDPEALQASKQRYFDLLDQGIAHEQRDDRGTGFSEARGQYQDLLDAFDESQQPTPPPGSKEKLTETFNTLRNGLINEHKQALENISNSEHKSRERALLIADHFARNPKENPLLVTLSTLFTHFQRIFIVNYQRWLCRRKGTPMPPDAELARMLKLSSAFFLKEYQQAASLYPNSRVFAIMGLIREYDLKSKGIDSGQATDGELLKELLLKIFVLR